MIVCVVLCLLQWFDEQQQSYELLDGHLKKLHQAIETMIQCRKGTHHLYNHARWYNYASWVELLAMYSTL